MNKEVFVNILNLIIGQRNRDEAFDKALNAFSPDSTYFPSPIGQELTRILEKTMNDTDELIYWAAFEQTFGQTGDVNIYQDDKIVATLDSPEAIYDYLKEHSCQKES